MKKFVKAAIAMTVCLLSLFVFSISSISASAYKTATVKIPVSCLDTSGGTCGSYKISIEPQNDSPAPSANDLDIPANGKGNFTISISEPGTYIYKVSEIPGNDPNITYDDKVYEITVFVENDGADGLKYSVSAKRSGTDLKSPDVHFKNIGDPNSTSKITKQTTAKTETTKKQTTKKATTTASSSDDSDGGVNPITGFINAAASHAVGLTMLAAVVIILLTLLLKRDNSEEDKNNER